MPGINLNISGQLNFLNNFIYSQELIDFKLVARNVSSDFYSISEKKNFYFNNGWFDEGDAEYYYQIIRTIKPNKIIEIGSGNSTIIASLALQKNKQEVGTAGKLVCIEPYENKHLFFTCVLYYLNVITYVIVKFKLYCKHCQKLLTRHFKQRSKIQNQSIFLICTFCIIYFLCQNVKN